MPLSAIEWLEGHDVVCDRCKEHPAVLNARKDNYCGECFVRFIRGKQRKSMLSERYKVRYDKNGPVKTKTRVLLAVSGGLSSLVLADCVGSMLLEQHQNYQGRTGYAVVVAVIEQEDRDKPVADELARMLARFSPVPIALKVVRVDADLDPATIKRIQITPEFAGVVGEVSSDEASATTVADLVTKCANKSAVEDLMTIVHRHLIYNTAVAEQCQTVLFGHSLSRVASEVLALTVNGRGSAIHEDISNREFVHQGHPLSVIYPLRDVLAVEIAAYAQIQHLCDFEVKSTAVKSKITKNLTVRDLITNYFAQLDATGYSSTAASVVKTGDKLTHPRGSPDHQCQVCGTDIYTDPRKWLQRITVETAAPLEDEDRANYDAYLAAHTQPEAQLDTPVDLCYGCIVTLRGSAPGMMWPVHENTERQPLGNRYLAEDIINELTID
ncbi:cytoplasmic tRNA 2-thiolation protein 2 [Diutina catenulata]